MISSSLFTLTTVALMILDTSLASHTALQSLGKMQPRSRLALPSRHFRRDETCVQCSDGNGCCDTGLTCVMFGKMAGCCPEGQDCSDSSNDSDVNDWDGEVDGPDGEIYYESTESAVVTDDTAAPVTNYSTTGTSFGEQTTDTSNAVPVPVSGNTSSTDQPMNDDSAISSQSDIITDDGSDSSTSSASGLDAPESEPVDDESSVVARSRLFLA
ncbi:hypothetical protein C8J56DRAFT_1065818 [Mycena floridula]|nr:hypothetical protein C8J56DRAFT_1065818 [Mycena floridula]